MNTATDPRFDTDLSLRMYMALRFTGIGVQEIADRLQVSRNAVSSWINGRHAPRDRDLKAFALATGYPLRWLKTGEAPAPDEGPGLPESRPRESNPRPFHYE